MPRPRWIESGAFLIAALLALWDGLSLQDASQPGARESGMYELLLGALLACFVVLYSIHGEAHEPEGRLYWRVVYGSWRAFVAFAVLLAYALAMPHLGYMLSTALLFVVYLRIFSPYRWTTILGTSVLLAVSSAWFWAEIVIVLPQGLVPWP